MADQFLSQDEVDALLDGVTGESQHPDKQEEAAGIRDYDLASQERIVRGRMPAMEVVNERFARNLRVGLCNFMRRSPQISVGPIRVVKYSTFLRDMAVPTNINIVSLAPLRGAGLLIFDPKLVFSVIESLFGGSGKVHARIEGRDFSPTEQRIIQRLLEVTLADYAKAWEALFRFNFAYQRSEMHTQFASIATPNEIVVTTTFNIEIGDGGGEVHICLPYSSLEPIRDILYSPLQGAGQENDNRWMKQLTKQVQSADVELTAELAQAQISVGQLLKLKAGDFIDLPLKEVINAKVGGVPVIECRFGTVNGRTAIRIERMLKYSQYSEQRKAHSNDN